MRRQMLRYPISRDIKRYVEDDHEWLILTDTRMHPLVTVRGDIDFIRDSTIMDAYEALQSRVQPNTLLKIYDLHTHPSSDLVPSPDDLKHFIVEKYQKAYTGIGVIGYGVITQKGIFLIKLPEEEKRLNELYRTFISKYSNNAQKYIGDKIESIPKRYFENNVKSSKKRRKRSTTLFAEAHKKSLQAIVKEEPDIITKKIPRPHRFNTGVRR